MALSFIVILRLTAYLIQSFSYLENCVSRILVCGYYLCIIGQIPKAKTWRSLLLLWETSLCIAIVNFEKECPPSRAALSCLLCIGICPLYIHVSCFSRAYLLLVYCVGLDSGGPAQHVLEVNFFMIMHSIFNILYRLDAQCRVNVARTWRAESYVNALS